MTAPKTSFYTSGRRLPYGDSYIITDQVYVQYRPGQKTSNSLRKYPILFIHGGGLTGAQWESTPDLRPGWAIRAAEAGFDVYTMDGVDSGRSQRAPDDQRTGPWDWRTARQVWERFRFGPPDRFEALELYPHSQFPVEAFDALVASQAVRRYYTTSDAEAQGIVDVVKRIGPCYVVAHSNGGSLTILALESIKDMVKGLALVEPSKVPSKVQDERVLEDVRSLTVWGDYLDSHELNYWPAIVRMWVHTEIMSLPKLGIRGNSHFPMSDKNSDQVAEKIFKWLEG